MKALKTILIILLILVGLFLMGAYFLLKSSAPEYEGERQLKGLDKKVEVYFDGFGVPHIYANHEADAQFALGYVHAQDRLFQMEMIRRVGRGELAEILGASMAETDRFFRTIGTLKNSQAAAAHFMERPDDDPVKVAALAYLDGVNAFIDEEDLPIEYQLMGIPPRHFSMEDSYAIFAYMAFSFAQAYRTDPLVMRLHEKLGPEYLKDLDLHWDPRAQVIPHYQKSEEAITAASGFDIKKAI